MRKKITADTTGRGRILALFSVLTQLSGEIETVLLSLLSAGAIVFFSTIFLSPEEFEEAMVKERTKSKMWVLCRCIHARHQSAPVQYIGIITTHSITIRGGRQDSAMEAVLITSVYFVHLSSLSYTFNQ